jgi:hypothetical protein
MRELLEFRTQIYQPTFEEDSNALSGVEILNYQEEDPSLPELLIVYELNTEQKFDAEMISQLVKDVFHDFFFKREIYSNVQIVEEAILDVKNKVLKLLKAGDKNFLDFNFVCGIFEKNNLSVVRYGKTFAHVFRDGILKELTFSKEGYFGSSQGNIKSGDLFILSTKNFKEKFVNDNLVKKGLKIEGSDLDHSSSSLILYFNKASGVVKTSNLLNSKRMKKKIQKQIIKYQGILAIILCIGCGLSGYYFYNDYKTKEILGASQILESQVTEVLGASFNNRDEFSSALLEQISIVGKSNIDNKDILISKLKEKYNQINFIQEKSFKLVYDFKEENPRISLSSLVIVGDAIYVLDQDTGKVYFSKLSNLDFKSKETGVEKPEIIDVVNRTLVIKSPKGLSYFTQDLNKDGNDLVLENLEKFTGFSTFIYELSGDKIYKTDTNLDNPKREVWAENKDLIEARDIDLDFDIFVLDQNSKVLRFSRGERVEFPFENSRFNLERMFIDRSLGNYFFSSENKFYIFSLDGKFKNQIIDSSFNSKIIDFSVFQDKIMFISNSKLFEISL